MCLGSNFCIWPTILQAFKFEHFRGFVSEYTKCPMQEYIVVSKKTECITLWDNSFVNRLWRALP